MRKLIAIITAISLTIAMFSCGNSETKADKKSETSVKNVEKSEKEDLLTKKGFEKMLSDYGISIYTDAKLKDIKKKSDDFVAIYTIKELSKDNQKKVEDYIAKELSKLKNKGWKVEERFGMAMKKENDYKASIQITQSYAPNLKIHEIIYSFGKVY